MVTRLVHIGGNTYSSMLFWLEIRVPACELTVGTKWLSDRMYFYNVLL